MNIRQQLVECLDCCEEITEIYDDLVNCQQRIVSMQSQENQLDDRKCLFRKLCLILTGIATFFIAIFLWDYGFSDTLLVLQELLFTRSVGICTIAQLLAIAIVIFALLWLTKAHKLRQLKAENQAKQPEIEREIQSLREQIQIYVDYAYEKGYFDIVPKDYFSCDMLKYCISVIDRKLANTLQEAFLLLEQELQRQENLSQQQMWHDLQAEQMERLTNAVHTNTMVTMLANQERYK